MQAKLDSLMDCLSQSSQTLLVGCSYRPMLFANSQISLFLLNSFKKNPYLVSRIKHAKIWKYSSLSIRRNLKGNPKIDQGHLFEVVVEDLIQNLGTLFTQPELRICTQGGKSSSIYFISSGNCVVSQRSYFRNEKYERKLLSSGDSFGEIGVIYNCSRTCTVMSTDYSIIAGLQRHRFRMLTSDYPELLTQFKRQVHRYRDPTKILVHSAF